MIKKYYFILLLIIFNSTLLFSSEIIYPDSIKTDIQRIQWLMSKGRAKLFTNLDSASIYAKKALTFNKTLKIDSLYANYCRLQGSIELYKGNNNDALKYYEKAHDIYLKIGNISKMSVMIYDMGIVYYNSSQFDKSLEKYLKALKYAQQIHDLQLMSDCYSTISFIYSEKKNSNKALEFMLKSLDIDKKLNYSIGLAYTYSNIADIYAELGLLDSVRHNRYKSIALFSKLGNNQGLAMAYSGLGSYFSSLNQYDSAMHYYKLSYYLREKVGDKMGKAITLNNLAENHFKLGNLSLAEKNAKKALQIASKIDGLAESQDANKILSEIAYKKNNFKEAYKFYVSYTQLKDSIFSKENMNKIAELEAKYENAKKESEIKVLTKENELHLIIMSREKKLRYALIIIGLLVVLFALILYSKNKYKTKVNTLLESQNKQLNQLNATQNKLMSIISHDFKAPLSAFYSITYSLKNKFDKISRDEIDSYFVHMLNSSIALKLQLENMLNWSVHQSKKIIVDKKCMNLFVLCQKVIIILQEVANEKKISIENKIDENIEIQTDRRLLSIVLNNLIANAIKYSPQNSIIIISAKQEDKNVLLSVKDNGVGMNKKMTDQLFITNGNIEKTENSGTGLGLIVSKEIVDSLSGKIWAESTLNKGTEIIIKL